MKPDIRCLAPVEQADGSIKVEDQTERIEGYGYCSIAQYTGKHKGWRTFVYAEVGAFEIKDKR